MGKKGRRRLPQRIEADILVLGVAVTGNWSSPRATEAGEGRRGCSG